MAVHDLFERKNIKPMLIAIEGEAFDSPDYIYELKLDGERCIAYLDPKLGTELRNKRNFKMLPKVPELSEIHKQVKQRCILDGERLILENGKPEFPLIQARSLMSNAFKIELHAQKHPATFVAYDILFLKDADVTKKPLIERKQLLQKVVKKESERFALSRFYEEKGKTLYGLAEAQELEGVVGKRKDSLYYFDKKTKDWIKFKYLQDEDYVVCGYIKKSNSMTSIVLGQYDGDQLIYKGHMTMGVNGKPF